MYTAQVKYLLQVKTHTARQKGGGGAHSISDVQEAAGLPPLAVHSQRVPYRCLHNKSVQGSAKYAIIVKPVDEPAVCIGLFSLHTVHNALPPDIKCACFRFTTASTTAAQKSAKALTAIQAVVYWYRLGAWQRHS